MIFAYELSINQYTARSSKHLLTLFSYTNNICSTDYWFDRTSSFYTLPTHSLLTFPHSHSFPAILVLDRVWTLFLLYKQCICISIYCLHLLSIFFEHTVHYVVFLFVILHRRGRPTSINQQTIQVATLAGRNLIGVSACFRRRCFC